MKLPDELPAQLRNKIAVDSATSCWLWQAARLHGKYGRVWFNGKNYAAHRIVYELLIGEITEETLDHLCGVCYCVNPNHLQPASVKDNILRGNGPPAQNARKTHCPVGHALDKRSSRSDGTTFRYCSICSREHTRKRDAKRRATKDAARKESDDKG